MVAGKKAKAGTAGEALRDYFEGDKAVTAALDELDDILAADANLTGVPEHVKQEERVNALAVEHAAKWNDPAVRADAGAYFDLVRKSLT